MFRIHRYLAFLLTVGFILATVIGTLTHELGHYVAAKLLGYEAVIHYASTSYAITNPNQTTGPADSFLITLGGPLETMLMGTIGLVLIFLSRKSFQTTRQLSFGQWTLVFASLFWLRQPANFLIWIGGYFLNGYRSDHTDEIRLANHLLIPSWTITVLTAMTGVAVLAVVVLKIVPASQRSTFVISGLAGGISGYVLWLHFIGPLLMP